MILLDPLSIYRGGALELVVIVRVGVQKVGVSLGVGVLAIASSRGGKSYTGLMLPPFMGVFISLRGNNSDLQEPAVCL